MNCLETAMVAVENFPKKDFVTYDPASTELEWIRALASIANAVETRKQRHAIEAQTSAIQQQTIVLNMACRAISLEIPPLPGDEPSRVPFGEIMDFVSYRVEQELERREGVIFGMIKRFLGKSEQESDD